MQRFRIITLGVAALAAVGTVGGATAQDRQAPPVTTGDAFQSGGKFGEKTGESLYRNVCAACHMPDAGGAVGAGYYPALAKNERLEASGYPLYVVMNGLNGMPAFGGMMSDSQVADVVNYVRTHFGNSYADAVTVEDVKALRAAE
jgi:mono/diheme cytochrome c family protein